MALVEVRRLTKQFRKGDETITPLDEVDLDFEEGEFLSLMGPERDRQEHAAQSDRRYRPAQFRIDYGRGNRNHTAISLATRRLAGRPSGLHLPDA